METRDLFLSSLGATIGATFRGAGDALSLSFVDHASMESLLMFGSSLLWLQAETSLGVVPFEMTSQLAETELIENLCSRLYRLIMRKLQRKDLGTVSGGNTWTVTVFIVISDLWQKETEVADLLSALLAGTKDVSTRLEESTESGREKHNIQLSVEMLTSSTEDYILSLDADYLEQGKTAFTQDKISVYQTFKMLVLRKLQRSNLSLFLSLSVSHVSLSLSYFFHYPVGNRSSDRSFDVFLLNERHRDFFPLLLSRLRLEQPVFHVHQLKDMNVNSDLNTETKQKVKALSFNLLSFLKEKKFKVKNNIYAVGFTSALIGNILFKYTPVSSNMFVNSEEQNDDVLVLVDRTVDVVTPMLQTKDCLKQVLLDRLVYDSSEDSKLQNDLLLQILASPTEGVQRLLKKLRAPSAGENKTDDASKQLLELLEYASPAPSTEAVLRLLEKARTVFQGSPYEVERQLQRIMIDPDGKGLHLRQWLLILTIFARLTDTELPITSMKELLSSSLPVSTGESDEADGGLSTKKDFSNLTDDYFVSLAKEIASMHQVSQPREGFIPRLFSLLFSGVSSSGGASRAEELEKLDLKHCNTEASISLSKALGLNSVLSTFGSSRRKTELSPSERLVQLLSGKKRNIVLFFVGGISFDELTAMQSYLASTTVPGCTISVGATNIASLESMLKSLA